VTPGKATAIKTFVLAAMLVLASGSLAEARGRSPLHRSGVLHRPAGLSPQHPPRERNIRSGDHFAWRPA
jgi:hypothetical protein